MRQPDIARERTPFGGMPSARPITTASTVAEARAHLSSTGETAAVVYQAGRPIGIVTAAALEDATSTRHSDVPLCRALDYVAVRVAPDAAAGATVRELDRAAWEVLRRRPGS